MNITFQNENMLPSMNELFQFHWIFQKIVIDIIKLLTIMMNIMISLLPWAAILNFTRQNYNYIQWMNQSWQISFFSYFLHWYTQIIIQFKKYRNFKMAAMTPFWISLAEIKNFVINNLIKLNSLNNLISDIDIIKISTDLW